MDNKTKKVLKAFDGKDLRLLTTMIAHHSIDPNKLIPDKGVTMLHLIIGHQSETFAFKVTKLFLRYGGDPNVPSEDGVTPIHVAAAWGRTRILHLLLVNGGDPWLQDDERKNAFNYAFEEQEWDAVEMLHHFQQVHSSANSKRDIEQTPKFELNFERILLRKGEEMCEYSLNDKIMKSTKTQTHTEFQEKNSTSPVLSKIKYFEFHPSNATVGWKKPEKTNFGWKKDCYETSCEIIVNSEENKSNNEETDFFCNKKVGKNYISSIHIDTESSKTEDPSPKDSVILLDKSSNYSSQKSTDIRSQLFMELQEAVLRRSKLKLNDFGDGNRSESEIREMEKNSSARSLIEMGSNTRPSIICSPNESDDKSAVIEDSFVAKEVSCLYGVNSLGNSLLKNMSDFATKVMKEIELNGMDNEAENRNEKESLNTVLTSTYMTCEEESDIKNDDYKVIKTLVIPDGNSNNDSLLETSNDSFMSITEEYKYTDKEEGVVLLEKKRVVTPSVSDLGNLEEYETESDRSSMVSNISSVPSTISYASDTLRTELTSFGFNPGPINKTTKKLYLKKLWKLKKANGRLSSAPKVYSSELEKTLRDESIFEKILLHGRLEEEMMETFDSRQNRKWREGASKTSFNYLLLDPRISLNLPRRALTMPDLDIWRCFLSSIFYVGKGKRARPYAHLYEAVSSWQKGCDKSGTNEKIQYISEIWSEDLGVVCLHVFQNIIPVEAYTREAAMIDALGLANLKNLKCGEYYGSPATWTGKDKLRFGVYLLYKAMLIFLNEGERQIRPFDIA